MVFDSRIHIMWPFMLLLHISFSQPDKTNDNLSLIPSACWHYSATAG